jgi:predicted DNA-binding transcriptional regulator AlpA
MQLVTFGMLTERPGFPKNWTTCNRWIERDGFPPGRLIGRQRWTEDELEAWVKSRPTAKARLRGRASSSPMGASDEQGNTGNQARHYWHDGQ